MKARTILAVAASAITLTSSALGDKYSDLVAKGYRWSIVDGLYACVSKDDVRRVVKAKLVESMRPGDWILRNQIRRLPRFGTALLPHLLGTPPGSVR